MQSKEMKKVIICMNELSTGGASRSLLNFAAQLKDHCDLTLMFFRADGNMMEQIPAGVKVVIPDGYMSTFVAGLANCKSLGIKKYLFKFMMGSWLKVFKTNAPFLKFALKHSEKLTGYDCAISFDKARNKDDAWVGIADYVLTNIDSKKKFIVTHDDYIEKDYNKHTIGIYKMFDKVFAVSESVQKNIASKVPELANVLDYMYNFCDVNSIVSKRDLLPGLYGKVFNIVSVGRLSEEKGLLRTLEVMKRLHDENHVFNYHIVGDGTQRSHLKEYIEKNAMSRYVILHGRQGNPFPYMKQADLFLLPSYREAAPMVYAESFLSGTPVLSTNTTSAKELVGKYGFICENTDDGIYSALLNLLDDKTQIDNAREQVKNYVYPNEEIIKKYEDLF